MAKPVIDIKNINFIKANNILKTALCKAYGCN